MPTNPFSAAGSLREAYEQTDWAATPLGPEQSWSPALCAALDLALHTRFPVALLWGPELVLVYNEAYVPLIADKHPAALGARACDVFPEIWATIGPLLEAVLDGGDATWVEDLRLPLHRRGRLEESFLTFSYSAVHGADGTVEGVVDIATETTQQVVDRRRLELLSRLGTELADAEHPQEVRERALPLLRAARADLPAVDVRLAGPDMAQDARLPAAPSAPLGQRDLVVEGTAEGRVAWLRLGAAEDGSTEPVLVTLLSEHLAPDEDYLEFLRLVAASLTQALDRVQTREAEQRAGTLEREGATGVARVLESMPGGFYSLDTDWRFSYVNSQAAAMMGRSGADAVGKVVWDLFPDAVGTVIEDVYRTAAATGEPASFDAYYPEPLNAWFELRVWPGPDGLGVYFLDITARRAAQELAERAVARGELMAAIASELASTLEAEQAVSRLPQLLVPALADWCIVTLANRNEHDSWRSRLQDTGSWHADPDLRELTERFAAARLAGLRDASGTARALRSQRPVVFDDLSTWADSAFEDGPGRELFDELAPQSAAVLPLVGRGRALGLLTVFNGPERGPFTAEDLSPLREIAGRVGLALDNAQLHAQQRDLAEDLQRSLLTELPEPDHLQVAARYVPAAQGAQVGGDWYDAFLVGRTTALVIGDVTGHDRGATVAMAQVRNVLRGVAHALVARPAQVLSALDRALEDLAVGTLTTAVLAQVEQDERDAARGMRTLRWSNAGHPPPLLLYPDGRAELLTRPADLLLGLLSDTPRQDHTQTLAPGATVLFYTDGLVERRGEDLDVGLERLRASAERLAGADLEALCDALLDELAVDAEDDVALLALRTHDQSRPRPPEAGPRVLPADLVE